MKKILFSAITAILVLAGSNSFAQVFISFDGVDGESTLKDMKGAFEAQALSWGASNASNTSEATGAARSRSRVKVADMVFTKQRGKASHSLQLGVFSGKQYAKVEVKYYKPGAELSRGPYLTFILEDVIITNWEISSSGSEQPTETFSINFARVKFEEAFTNPDGTGGRIKGGWDFVKNIPIQW